MRIRLTDAADGRIAMESPYDANFLAQFKAAITWGGRAWDAASKRWLLSPLAVGELEDLCQREGITIIDARAVTAVMARDNPYALMPEDLKAGFATLYLAPNAPLCVAEASYKALAKVFHPDMEVGDERIMGDINNAIITIRRYLTA